MKKTGLLMLGLLLIGRSVVADELEKGFATPPDAAKNQVWWHWLQGNVTREGITADLEAMKSVGVGGAQIFKVEGLPKGQLAVAIRPARGGDDQDRHLG